MTTDRTIVAEIFSGISITGSSQTAGIGGAFSASYSSIGGLAPLTYSVTGTLPGSVTAAVSGTGVVLSSSTLVGTDSGLWTFTITARDAQRIRVQKTFTMFVIALPLSFSNSFANYTAGVVQSFTYTTTGGYGGCTFAVTTGTLPPGLSLSSGGTITGNTTGLSVGTHSYPFVVTATDTHSGTATISQNVTVTVVAISITNSATTPGAGSPYTFTYTSSGGTGTKTWTKQSGTLPTGLSLSTSGVLSGTATTPATYSWVVAVTDNAGTVATESQTVTVAYPTLTLTGTYTASVTVLGSYSSSLTIAGGNGVYSNPRVTSGTLPAGLALSIVGSTLVLSGTPSTVTNYSFTAAVDSGDGQTATSPQTVNVTTDATAVSIYNKLYNGSAFTGDYWNMTEASGARASASGNFNLTVQGSAHIDATETGPRGGGDKAWTTGGTASVLDHTRALNDALDVATNYGFYVFVKFHATTANLGIGGTYAGDSPPNGGIVFWTKTTGGISAYAGNSAGGVWTTADGSIPDTTNWHLLAGWRDNADGKLRLAIDGGTAIASPAAFTPTNTAIDIEFGGTGLYVANCGIGPSCYAKGSFLTQAEQVWLYNTGLARHWSEIKTLAGH